MLLYLFESILPIIYSLVSNGYPDMGLRIYHAFIAEVGIYALNWLIGYIFLGIGLFVMAKRRNMKIAYLAWIPFASTYLMGKLIGEINFFGLKIKRMGLIALIVELLAFALLLAEDLLNLPLLLDVWDNVFNKESYEYIYGTIDVQTGQIITPGAYYNYSQAEQVVNLFSVMISAVNEIIGFVLLIFLFRNYAPRSGFLFAFLSFVLPILGPILVFAIRKNSCEEYREFMKMKMHAMYGGGNPYQYDGGEYRDPFDLSESPKNNKEEKPESPFSEYDD